MPTPTIDGAQARVTRPAPAGFAGGSDGSDYESGLKCRICYMKHLSKAWVEIGECVEDSDRYEELSLGIGDMACAEDHARALGLHNEADEIRVMRSDVLRGSSSRRSVPPRLLAMAARQAREVVSDMSPSKEEIVAAYASRKGTPVVVSSGPAAVDAVEFSVK